MKIVNMRILVRVLLMRLALNATTNPLYCVMSVNGMQKIRKPHISPAKREFTLYKKGQPVFTGTRKQIANHLGVKEESVAFYGSKTYERRTSENAMRIVEITGWNNE